MFHVEQKQFPQEFLESLDRGARSLGFVLTEENLEKFQTYFQELCHWDKSINLTGLRTDLEKAVLLFVDSLAGGLVLQNMKKGLVVDIGTGGGFPGIPLKILFPEHQFYLIEPKEKKVSFLRLVIGKIGLEKTRVIQSRLEEVNRKAPEHDLCDMAFIKGVKLGHVEPFMQNILKKSGKLVVFRARNIENEEPIGKMIIQEEIPYELPFGFGSRVLSILRYPDSESER